MNYTNEKMIKNNNFIKTYILEKIKTKAEKSLCKIEGNNVGTGFFIKLSIPSEKNPMYGLMTNHHVLNFDYMELEENEPSFKFYVNNHSYIVDLNNNNSSITDLDNNDSFIVDVNNHNFKFSCELIDITFIQLTGDFINNPNINFLESYSNTHHFINEKELINIIQYPHGQGPYLAYGTIDRINNFNIYYRISTEEGSSGSPLLDNNIRVIGVHKSGSINNGNLATNFNVIEHAISILYDRKYLCGPNHARMSARKLDEYENDEFKDHGLITVLENNIPNLYQCRYLNTYYFYRTNHGWYWTEIKEIDTSNCRIDTINKYDWKLINPFDHINIKCREHHLKVILTWLKLSELMYMY